MFRQFTHQPPFPTVAMNPVTSFLLATAVPALVFAQEPPELQPVQWNLGANVQVINYSGGLTKPTGGTGWTGGAASAQMILRNGRVEFQPVPGSQMMVGLSTSSANDGYTEIDYAIYIIPSGTSTTTGTAQVYENGTAVAALALGNFATGAIFTIERVGNQISYSRSDPINGTTTKTSLVLSYSPLLVDTTFYKQGSVLNSVSIATGDKDSDSLPDDWETRFLPPSSGWGDLVNFIPAADQDQDGASNYQEFLDNTDPTDSSSVALPVDWQNRVNTTILGGGLGGLQRGTAAAAWTADADSSNQVIIGDGLVSFTVPLASYLTVGLTPSNDNRAHTDLEYRIHVTSANTCSLRSPELTTADKALGSYTATTIFTIQRTNGIVQFLKDGVIVHTSTVRSSGKLLVDCSLYSPSTKINSARVATGDVDGDEIPDTWELTYLSAQPGFASENAFAALNAFLPSGDTDGDGLTNLQEYLDDTHPFQSLGYSTAITWKTGVTSPAVMSTSGVDGEVKKTASANVWNADAVAMKDATTPRMIIDSGKVAFNVAPGSYLAVGFTRTNDNRLTGDLEYMIMVTSSNTALAYQGTTQIAALGTYNASTRFALRRVGTVIEYLKDGVIYATSTLPATAPLLVDSSFYSLNAEITSAHLYTGDLDEDGIPDGWEIGYLTRWLGHVPSYLEMRDELTAGTNGPPGTGTPGDLDGDGYGNLDEFRSYTEPTQQTSHPEPVVWTAFTNTTAIGSDGGLKKISGISGSYDAWAGSSQYYDGDVVLTFTASNAGVLNVGLTQDTTPSSPPPEYRIVLSTTGASLFRPESGASLTLGAYDTNTTFAIRRTGRIIDYLINGVVAATSTTESTTYLRVNGVIATLNHQISSARVARLDANGDGIPDRWELDQLWQFLGKPAYFNASQAQLNALQGDLDMDQDDVELAAEYEYGTSDATWDTDSDGISDWWEIHKDLNPTDSSDAVADSDGDGFTNLQEYQWSHAPRYLDLEMGRNDDVDVDGLPDAWEVQVFGDLRAQIGTGDPDHDGVTNLDEFLANTSPTEHPGDADHDGIPDSLELTVFGNLSQTGAGDFDHDGLSNFVEIYVTLTDSLLADTNSDGYMDGYLGSFIATDSDGDGLTNLQEVALGSDAFLADTDGDGVIDSLDAYPINAMLQAGPQANPLDTVPPIITLAEPLNAQLIP